MASKEAAKFLSGFAANQVLTHGALAVAGTRFTVMGIDYTPGLNAGAVLIWLSVMAFLIHYAWLRTRAA